jgi:hypothetical protein
MAHRIFIDPIYENRAEALLHELCDQIFQRVAPP